MMRLTLLSLLLCGFLVTPALCTTGALSHDCDDCGVEIECDHEDDCYEDPCSDDPTAPNPASLVFDHGVEIAHPLHPASFVVQEAPPYTANLLRTNLPVPDSQLPLLN